MDPLARKPERFGDRGIRDAMGAHQAHDVATLVDR
jgi:hypothetical protein